MEVIPKVETDKFQNTENTEVVIELEYLILYDPEGNQLAKSDNKVIGSKHEVEYDGLIYLANELGRISIDYNSMINKFKDE